MIGLYSSSSSTFILGPPALPAAEQRVKLANAARLLRRRGSVTAATLLEATPFRMLTAVNDFGADIVVLYAELPLDTYEELRRAASAPRAAGTAPTFRQIAETVSEIGPCITHVVIDLELGPAAELTAADRARALTRKEVRAIVEHYMGVDQGYLADLLTYKSHRDFYSDLGLEINPEEYPGTTRARFTRILSEQPPAIQARILRGVLERYPPGSAALRSTERAEKIRGLIVRLSGTAPVAPPAPNISSDVVERALADAEHLISTRSATSGVDRVHTALHGYLRAACKAANIETGEDPTSTQLLKVLREKHPAFATAGPRAEDIRTVLRSMGAILSALDPLRNRASLAHPNDALLEGPEAMLVVNATRTLLHYLDAKLSGAGPGTV